jgi:hypothetical protein
LYSSLTVIVKIPKRFQARINYDFLVIVLFCFVFTSAKKMNGIHEVFVYFLSPFE